MGLGFGGRAGGRGVRAREVLAKLSGGRDEGRSSSLQTRGSQLGAQAGGGRVRASARRAVVLWGAPRAFGVSACKSKQAETESSKCTQTYFCPGNPSLSEVQAFLLEPGNGQRELDAGWIVREMPPPPIPRAIFTLHFGAFVRGGGGREIPLPPSLHFPKVECWGRLTLFFLKVSEPDVGAFLGGGGLFI